MIQNTRNTAKVTQQLSQDQSKHAQPLNKIIDNTRTKHVPNHAKKSIQTKVCKSISSIKNSKNNQIIQHIHTESNVIHKYYKVVLNNFTSSSKQHSASHTQNHSNKMHNIGKLVNHIKT